MRSFLVLGDEWFPAEAYSSARLQLQLVVVLWSLAYDLARILRIGPPVFDQLPLLVADYLFETQLFLQLRCEETKRSDSRKFTIYAHDNLRIRLKHGAILSYARSPGGPAVQGRGLIVFNQLSIHALNVALVPGTAGRYKRARSEQPDVPIRRSGNS